VKPLKVRVSAVAAIAGAMIAECKAFAILPHNQGFYATCSGRFLYLSSGLTHSCFNLSDGLLFSGFDIALAIA
jgi:hypothetical protein